MREQLGTPAEYELEISKVNFDRGEGNDRALLIDFKDVDGPEDSRLWIERINKGSSE